MESKIQLILTFLIVCALFISGCDSTLTPYQVGDKISSDIEFVVEEQNYTSGDQIEVQLYSQSSSTYYIPLPNAELTIEQKVDSNWENRGTWYYTIQVVPRAQPLSEYREEGFSINASDLIERFGEGTYRFRQFLYYNDELKPEYKLAIYSNDFSLTKQ